MPKALPHHTVNTQFYVEKTLETQGYEQTLHRTVLQEGTQPELSTLPTTALTRQSLELGLI